MAKTYRSTRKTTGIVNEPAAVYVSHSSQSSYISSLLGLHEKINNDLDYVNLTRKGIKKDVILSVTKKLGITLERMSGILHMSPRTFQRLKETEPLDIYTSEQTIEMVRVLARCYEVFEDEEAARAWLNSPLMSLGNINPIDLLDTSFGVQIVLDALGRIEHGVYS